MPFTKNKTMSRQMSSKKVPNVSIIGKLELNVNSQVTRELFFTTQAQKKRTIQQWLQDVRPMRECGNKIFIDILIATS